MVSGDCFLFDLKGLVCTDLFCCCEFGFNIAGEGMWVSLEWAWECFLTALCSHFGKSKAAARILLGCLVMGFCFLRSYFLHLCPLWKDMFVAQQRADLHVCGNFDLKFTAAFAVSCRVTSVCVCEMFPVTKASFSHLILTCRAPMLRRSLLGLGWLLIVLRFLKEPQGCL